MYMKSATALLLSATMMAGVAVAQTNPTPMSPAPTPTTAAPPAPAAAAPAMSGQFMTDQGKGEFRASKFVGLSIYGPDNQRIGDINEILIDGAGSAKAVVIGVGGFLGLGEKNVAVPFSAIEWMNERPASTGSTTPAQMAGGTMGNPANITGSTVPMRTASTRSPEETAAYNGYPDHGMVKMTKAELQNAPTFKYYADTHSASNAGTTAPPRQ